MTEEELQEYEEQAKGMVGYAITHRGVGMTNIETILKLCAEVRRLKAFINEHIEVDIFGHPKKPVFKKYT